MSGTTRQPIVFKMLSACQRHAHTCAADDRCTCSVLLPLCAPSPPSAVRACPPSATCPPLCTRAPGCLAAVPLPHTPVLVPAALSVPCPAPVLAPPLFSSANASPHPLLHPRPLTAAPKPDHCRAHPHPRLPSHPPPTPPRVAAARTPAAHQPPSVPALPCLHLRPRRPPNCRGPPAPATALHLPYLHFPRTGLNCRAAGAHLLRCAPAAKYATQAPVPAAMPTAPRERQRPLPAAHHPPRSLAQPPHPPVPAPAPPGCQRRTSHQRPPPFPPRQRPSHRTLHPCPATPVPRHTRGPTAPALPNRTRRHA
ncbi:hypothetical protein GGX14DRAFT_580970 [Mycena pura]|uniref:Uncharacterized protein n=1 Tax=Mycena pura TaxID=153505 RepID=A0AAD6UKJ3_9AGAR|nr:hypothetical protein GGX14DRAFT_580970 [Mycena pura]